MSRPSDSKQKEMPFLEHLEELRWRILWSGLTLLVGCIVGFVAVRHFQLLDVLITPVRPYVPNGQIGYLNPADAFVVTVQLALILGCVLALPVIIYQTWAFLAPALHQHEKRAIALTLCLGLLLFTTGATLAYFFALPMSLKFFAGFATEAVRADIVLGSYFALVTRLLLGFGAMFEIPIVILLLTIIGLVDSKMLVAKRRYAVGGAAIVAALITPGDLVILTAFMMLPLLLLFESSIWLTRLVERHRDRAREMAILPLLWLIESGGRKGKASTKMAPESVG